MSDPAAGASQQPRPPAGKGGSARACFKCGKSGHWSRDCTAPREEWVPQQPREFGSTQANAGGDLGDPEAGGDGPGTGPGASKPVAPAKKSNKKPKFTTVEHLLGPDGIAYVANVIPEKFAQIAKGPGHEFGDFARLTGLYREWTRKMYPFATHEEVMLKVKRLARTREVRACVREIKERERIEQGGEGVAAPDDFQPEDVFFPDDADVEETGAAADDLRDDDEEEWNEARHGGGGDEDEDEELAILMEQEREFSKKGAPASSKSPPKKGKENEEDDDEENEELDILRREEAAASTFDDKRREGLENVNFDESSDDDELEIALPRRGRGMTARKAAAMGAGEKGKARKKLKEKVAKTKKKKEKKEKKEKKGGLSDRKLEAARAREAAEAAEAAANGTASAAEKGGEEEDDEEEPEGESVHETEPEPEPEPEPFGASGEARKKLGGKGRLFRAAKAAKKDDDTESEDESESESEEVCMDKQSEEEARNNRPRRRVAIDDDSDDDDDDVPPVAMGGDAFLASPLPSISRPAFLFDDDDDDGGGGVDLAAAAAVGFGVSPGQKRSAQEADL